MRNLTSKRNTRGGNGRIFGSLVGELQQRLNRGEWQPGEHLPSITHLAHTFGVSTGSVREALRFAECNHMLDIDTLWRFTPCTAVRTNHNDATSMLYAYISLRLQGAQRLTH